ncbi:MAG: 23S rRNA (adenine(2503)-C(2))-methyltransferase RlmN [Acidobacteria bacterium]|jgi:23S rRNA (adenine2503-C2)-methyltransferase|nr:23S rRNA (adenine(2503)-C(2))-methyltransferase RlmN [Acidobacteriota bacterium]
MRNESAPPSLLGLSRDGLTALVSEWSFKAIHARSIWRHLHAYGRTDFGTLGGLPAGLIDRLSLSTTASWLGIARDTESRDGFTRKYLLQLDDGKQIETVLMRYAGRVTACVSTQAGCAMGCVFCATGQMGFARHLTTAEIVAQALHVSRVLAASTGERLRNLVLMGMGEPLHNYDATIAATHILGDTAGLALSPARMTLSTVGVVPGIVRLADDREPVSLAVSLHGATQEARAAMVPVAKAWPLDVLMEACRYYCDTMDRHIFYEWTLIEGANDRPEDAHALGRLLERQRAHVNLIPLNPTDGYGGLPTTPHAARQFQSVLAEYGLPSTVRQRRGIDIAAGCGQLASAR